MIKFKAVLAFLFLFLFTIIANAQIRSEQDAANLIMQPNRSIRGDSIHFTSNQYLPRHNGKAVKMCKGAVLRPSGTAGYLAVHLTGDPAGYWYALYLANDCIPIGCEFDAVGDSTKGSSIARDTSLYIFPYLYKNP